MAKYTIAETPVGNGWLGLGPIPGRGGAYDADIDAIVRWGADLVLTMTMHEELEYVGASTIGADLELAGVRWLHLPIHDMNAPPPQTEALWTGASEKAHGLFETGGRVFTHCFGGCGRAGMAALRLMIEAGAMPEVALENLRAVRPCAIETDAQFAWSAAGQR